MNARAINALLAVLAVFVILAVTIGAYAVVRSDRESAARCEQIHKLTDAVRGIVGFVNVPNPSRSPAQQQAIDSFVTQADTLLNSARPC